MRPSMLVVETGLSMIVVAAAFCFPRTGSALFRRAERWLSQLARRRRVSVLMVGLAALVLRLSSLPLNPIPQPFIHDEFSYLLAGNTFAQGRLTNPTHPMWRHLESFHIDQQPTYMSMYPPVQGMVLAAGERFAGNPWYGVCASAALMCAVLCWMLQGWVPPAWALLGGALAVLRLGLFSYWVNGYYGGAAAAIGGALVLGCVPRILRSARLLDGILLGLGTAILANTRPWEGLLLCAPVAVALVWTLAKTQRLPVSVFVRRATPAAVILVLTAAFMGYYNYRVFRNPLTLPYQVNRATYAVAPVFLWKSPRPAPVYRFRELHEFYTKWELGDFLYAKTTRGFLSRSIQKMGIAYFFVYGPALTPPLVLFLCAARSPRLRILTATGVFFAAGLALNAWFFPHYAAPFVAALYVFLLEAMRRVRLWRPAGQPYGLAMVRVIPLACVLLAGIRLFAAPLGMAIPRFPTMWYGTEPLGLPRARVAKELAACPGKQLAIVRYSEHHSVFDDWVYNAADIDHARVVWARETGGKADAELLSYFRDRTAWLVEPDANPPRIAPYTEQGASSSTGSRISRCR